jgi:hypothetical protein
MIDRTKGLSDLGLDNAIRLRWVLRDIKGNRLKLSPPSQANLQVLIDMGFVEMRDNKPVVSPAGVEEMGRGDLLS